MTNEEMSKELYSIAHALSYVPEPSVAQYDHWATELYSIALLMGTKAHERGSIKLLPSQAEKTEQ